MSELCWRGLVAVEGSVCVLSMHVPSLLQDVWTGEESVQEEDPSPCGSSGVGDLLWRCRWRGCGGAVCEVYPTQGLLETSIPRHAFTRVLTEVSFPCLGMFSARMEIPTCDALCSFSSSQVFTGDRSLFSGGQVQCVVSWLRGGVVEMCVQDSLTKQA